MITKMVGNRSFIHTTRNGKRSRSQRLKNGIPKDLSWHSFNIYVSDLPTTVSRKHAYADDLAIIMYAVEGC